MLVRMRTTMIAVLMGLATGASACGSPSAPSASNGPSYELIIAASPSCAALTQDHGRYGFFTFGLAVMHLQQTTSTHFVMIDDQLAHGGGACGREAITLDLMPAAVGSAIEGRLGGVAYLQRACSGPWVEFDGAVTGDAQSDTWSGTWNGGISMGTVAVNPGGRCPAADHRWSLRPVRR